MYLDSCIIRTRPGEQNIRSQKKVLKILVLGAETTALT